METTKSTANLYQLAELIISENPGTTWSTYGAGVMIKIANSEARAVIISDLPTLGFSLECGHDFIVIHAPQAPPQAPSVEKPKPAAQKKSHGASKPSNEKPAKAHGATEKKPSKSWNEICDDSEKESTYAKIAKQSAGKPAPVPKPNHVLRKQKSAAARNAEPGSKKILKRTPTAPKVPVESAMELPFDCITGKHLQNAHTPFRPRCHYQDFNEKPCDGSCVDYNNDPIPNVYWGHTFNSSAAHANVVTIEDSTERLTQFPLTTDFCPHGDIHACHTTGCPYTHVLHTYTKDEMEEVAVEKKKCIRESRRINANAKRRQKTLGEVAIIYMERTEGSAEGSAEE